MGFLGENFSKDTVYSLHLFSLLKELLKFTVRANLKHSDFEAALVFLSSISRRANEAEQKFHIEGYHGEISIADLGRLIRQELVLFWEEKPRGKGKERDVFLFEKGIVNTKRKEGGRKFIFKNMLKVRNTLEVQLFRSFKPSSLESNTVCST